MVEEIDTALPIGMLAISRSTDDQTFRVQRQTHGGTHSDARLSNGTVTLVCFRRVRRWPRGEPAALNTLLAALRAQGLSPTRSVANDDRGEDAVIEIGARDGIPSSS